MTFDDINLLASKRIPFLFISDFKAQNIKIIKLVDLKSEDIEYSISNLNQAKQFKNNFTKIPISFSNYKKKFDKVIEKIKSGDTYLLNLTQATKLKTNCTLKEIFTQSNAKYKLRYKDEFVCFSPESFIKIQNNTIHTYPMKGTIDASIDNAKEKILNDKKELAEHIMIVDLLRNDLSIVSNKVKVKKFRYVEEIEAGDKKLLQVSSHISGELDSLWRENLGSILNNLLPAGSISGTPKKSTLQIIENVEDYDREYFSGVFGIFDGKSFDSGVMIRFIQKKKNELIYKSGGGITLDSNPVDEYNELLDKVYIP
jgi:para-aminobenzoate synthetase component 1